MAKNSSFGFLALAYVSVKKPNVLFVRLAFLVQTFNFSTIFALCTTCLYNASGVSWLAVAQPNLW